MRRCGPCSSSTPIEKTGGRRYAKCPLSHRPFTGHSTPSFIAGVLIPGPTSSGKIIGTSLSAPTSLRRRGVYVLLLVDEPDASAGDALASVS